MLAIFFWGIKLDAKMLLVNFSTNFPLQKCIVWVFSAKIHVFGLVTLMGIPSYSMWILPPLPNLFADVLGLRREEPVSPLPGQPLKKGWFLLKEKQGEHVVTYILLMVPKFGVYQSIW